MHTPSLDGAQRFMLWQMYFSQHGAHRTHPRSNFKHRNRRDLRKIDSVDSLQARTRSTHIKEHVQRYARVIEQEVVQGRIRCNGNRLKRRHHVFRLAGVDSKLATSASKHARERFDALRALDWIATRWRANGQRRLFPGPKQLTVLMPDDSAPHRVSARARRAANREQVLARRPRAREHQRVVRQARERRPGDDRRRRRRRHARLRAQRRARRALLVARAVSRLGAQAPSLQACLAGRVVGSMLHSTEQFLSADRPI